MRRRVEEKSREMKMVTGISGNPVGKDKDQRKRLENNGFMRFSRNVLVKIHGLSIAFFDDSCIISLD